MTRIDPAVSGAEQSVGTPVDPTVAASPAKVERSPFLRPHGDAEMMAMELLDRLGPSACAALAVWLLDLAREVAR